MYAALNQDPSRVATQYRKFVSLEKFAKFLPPNKLMTSQDLSLSMNFACLSHLERFQTSSPSSAARVALHVYF